jgi:hypothetical protein
LRPREAALAEIMQDQRKAAVEADPGDRLAMALAAPGRGVGAI